MDLFFQDEREIINLAASVDDPDVCFYPRQTNVGLSLLSSLRGSTLTQRERPDFEDLAARVLVEVMRVDDHARINGKDDTRALEAQMLRELRDAGIADSFPNASLTAIARTDLSTNDDHNYAAYVRHFAKVVTEHSEKVDVYRGTHPGFDLGFLILDESTGYYETLGAFGSSAHGRPHAHFADASFLTVLESSHTDCLAWLTPYKRMMTDQGEVKLPTLTLIDVAAIASAEAVRFVPSRMRSTEI